MNVAQLAAWWQPWRAGVRRGHNRKMNVIADLCVVPIGIGVSVSKEVAMCERILAAAGLKTHLHAYGTNIEGEWDQVLLP